jgi:GTP cyclohydrolase IA
MSRIEDAVWSLLKMVEPDTCEREGLAETPSRVARMYKEIFGGYEIDPQAFLAKNFEADGYKQMVIVRDIPFYSHCEHHMVPFFGKCHVGYIPDGRVVGLSKLARVVEGYARRLQIQERLTSQICSCVADVLKPKGVIVVMKAEHMCMTMRGVKKPGSLTVTSDVKGVFFTEDTAKQEFYNNLKI